MATSHVSGPSVSYGKPAAGSTAGNNPVAGPSASYQGYGVLDSRAPYQPGVTGAGHFRMYQENNFLISVDAVPATFSTTIIAAAQAGTSGTALTLAAANAAGVGVNYPIIPAGLGYSTGNIVKALALDPGFVSVTLTGTNTAQLTITAANLALFQRFVPNLTVLVGVNAGTTWTAARVLTVSGTTITLDTVITGSSGATAWVALANGAFRPGETPIASTPFLTAGAAAVYDYRSGLARGVSITTAGSNTAGSVLVTGYDLFGNPMSEAIACATASTFYGNKAFKFIVSAVPSKSGGGAMTGNISVGTSDLFGFAARSDAWEYSDVMWAGAFMTSSTGWFAADTTSPATTATKDVRGAIQVSGNGPNGSGIGSTATNGTRRLYVAASTPIDNMYFTDPGNTVPMFGVAQV